MREWSDFLKARKLKNVTAVKNVKRDRVIISFEGGILGKLEEKVISSIHM